MTHSAARRRDYPRRGACMRRRAGDLRRQPELNRQKAGEGPQRTLRLGQQDKRTSSANQCRSPAQMPVAWLGTAAAGPDAGRRHAGYSCDCTIHLSPPRTTSTQDSSRQQLCAPRVPPKHVSASLTSNTSCSRGKSTDRSTRPTVNLSAKRCRKPSSVTTVLIGVSWVADETIVWEASPLFPSKDGSAVADHGRAVHSLLDDFYSVARIGGGCRSCRGRRRRLLLVDAISSRIQRR